MSENVARRRHKENDDHHTHCGGKARVDSGRGLDSLNVQSREHRDEEEDPSHVRDRRGKFVRLLAAPDGADHGIEQVIHYHAPAGDIAERGIDLLPHVGERGAGAGIGTRHAAIAEGGEQHGNHGNQDRGDHVPVAPIAERSKHRHRRGRLDDDDAVEDQVPQGEGAAKMRRGFYADTVSAGH